MHYVTDAVLIIGWSTVAFIVLVCLAVIVGRRLGKVNKQHENIRGISSGGGGGVRGGRGDPVGPGGQQGDLGDDSD